MIFFILSYNAVSKYQIFWLVYLLYEAFSVCLLLVDLIARIALRRL